MKIGSLVIMVIDISSEAKKWARDSFGDQLNFPTKGENIYIVSFMTPCPTDISGTAIGLEEYPELAAVPLTIWSSYFREVAEPGNVNIKQLMEELLSEPAFG